MATTKQPLDVLAATPVALTGNTLGHDNAKRIMTALYQAGFGVCDAEATASLGDRLAQVTQELEMTKRVLAQVGPASRGSKEKAAAE